MPHMWKTQNSTDQKHASFLNGEKLVWRLDRVIGLGR